MNTKKKFRMWLSIFLTSLCLAGYLFLSRPGETENVQTVDLSDTTIPLLATTTTQINYGAAEAAVAQFEADKKAYLEFVALNAFLADLEAQRLHQEELKRQEEARQAEQKRQEAAQAVRARPAPSVSSGSVWDRLAQCESGGNWSYPPVSGGFSGGIMFHIGTWRAMGGTQYAPDAYLASREQQIAIAEKVLAVQGWGAWPGCSRKLGLR